MNKLIGFSVAVLVLSFAFYAYAQENVSENKKDQDKLDQNVDPESLPVTNESDGQIQPEECVNFLCVEYFDVVLSYLVFLDTILA